MCPWTVYVFSSNKTVNAKGNKFHVFVFRTFSYSNELYCIPSVLNGAQCVFARTQWEFPRGFTKTYLPCIHMRKLICSLSLKLSPSHLVPGEVTFRIMEHIMDTEVVKLVKNGERRQKRHCYYLAYLTLIKDSVNAFFLNISLCGRVFNICTVR